MTEKTRKKTMHINLHGDQVDDYEICRAYTGITNDNDLIRHLLREKAIALRGLQLGGLKLQQIRQAQAQ